MKKIIGRSLSIMVFCLILLFITGSMALAEDKIYKVRYFNGGTLSISESEGDSEKKVGSSIAFSYERALEINESFELGYGASFQFSGDFEGDILSKSHCLPLYILLNYYPLSIEGLPYLTGHLGYNFMFYDVDDNKGTLKGLYFAAGAGIRIPKYPSIRAELLYIVNNGSGDVEHWYSSSLEKVDASLARISLSVGLGY